MAARRRGIDTGRYERRTRRQARHIEKRLERVKRARAQRTQHPVRDRRPKKPARVGVKRALLFAVPLFAGALLASTAVEAARSWWNGTPADVEAIAVLGNERLSGAAVAAATGLSYGQALLDLSEAEIEARVARHPWIRNVRVALLPTGTVVVEVEERVPRARLVTTETSGAVATHLVDAQCIPFLRLSPEAEMDFDSLPRITAEAGQPLPANDPELCSALSLAEAVRANGAATGTLPSLAAFDVVLPAPTSQDGWILREPARHEVLLGRGSEAELDERLARLGQLFAANPEQLQQAQTIDLRFAEQAVLRSFGASR